MKAEAFLRQTHGTVPTLFLLARIPAAAASAQGNAESPWVYAPLPFLLALIITGTYKLVRPWMLRLLERRERQGVIP